MYPDQQLKNDKKSKPADPKKQKQRKKRIGLIITIVTAAVLVLCAAGFAIWFYVYMNSDSKILSDALDKSITAKSVQTNGEIKISSRGASEKATISVKFSAGSTENSQNIEATVSVKSAGQVISVQVAAIYSTDGDLYVKVKDIKKALLDLGISQSDIAELNIDNINNRWIRISKSTIDNFLSDAYADTDAEDTMSCMSNALEQISRDKNMAQELSSAITDSGYFVATREGEEQIDGQSTIRYGITVDPANGAVLSDNVSQTNAYRLLSTCVDQSDDSYSSYGDRSSDYDVDAKFTIWVNKSSHEPVRVGARLSEDNVLMSATINLSLNRADIPSTPKDSIDIEDLNQVLSEITNSAITTQLN